MDAVEDIKSRLSIEDVIADYLELKRSGRNFKALSPFTNEKTPSFMISPEKQIWHDFSSGKGGNMFSFVMEVEGVDFKGALELLARKAGIDISDYRSSSHKNTAKLKERLFEALEQATSYYQRQLTKHDEALKYVRQKRGFDKQTMLDFRIGYAPEDGQALYKHLSDKGFKDEELQKAGLNVVRYNKQSDMFRGRIMVPLMDAHGRVVGFTARLLKDSDTAPKYINTPQTILYDKGRHVFAFHLAKEAIRKEKVCVLVEGNLDVVSAHQAGTKHVVATAGTALTEGHIKAVRHFTEDIRICFDQDSAGQSAVERSLAVASRMGVSLSVLPLPEGKDPDDVIREDKTTWQKVLDSPVYGVDWLIDRYIKQLDISTAKGKREFTDIILKRLADIKDPVEQDHYVGVVARRIEVSEDALRSKLSRSSDTPTRPKKRTKAVSASSPSKSEAQLQERTKLRDHLLAIGLYQPALRKSVIHIPKEVIEKQYPQQLFDLLEQYVDGNKDIFMDNALKEISEYVKILQLQFEQLYKELDLIELRDEVARLKTRLIERYVAHKKQSLTEQLSYVTDEATESTLLAQVDKLNALLKR
jgi:DNA primase